MLCSFVNRGLKLQMKGIPYERKDQEESASNHASLSGRRFNQDVMHAKTLKIFGQADSFS